MTDDDTTCPECHGESLPPAVVDELAQAMAMRNVADRLREDLRLQAFAMAELAEELKRTKAERDLAEARLIEARHDEALRIVEWLLRRHQAAIENGNGHIQWQRWAAEDIRSCYIFPITDEQREAAKLRRAPIDVLAQVQAERDQARAEVERLKRTERFLRYFQVPHDTILERANRLCDVLADTEHESLAEDVCMDVMQLHKQLAEAKATP